MITKFYHNRTFYFKYIEPRVLEGKTFADISRELGINRKIISFLRGKYKGTKPVRARSMLRLKEKERQKEDKLLQSIGMTREEYEVGFTNDNQ